MDCLMTVGLLVVVRGLVVAETLVAVEGVGVGAFLLAVGDHERWREVCRVRSL